MDFDGEAALFLFRDQTGQLRKGFDGHAAKTTSMGFVGEVRLDERGSAGHWNAVEKYLYEARRHGRAREFCPLFDELVADEMVEEACRLRHHGANHPSRKRPLRIEMVVGGQDRAANCRILQPSHAE